MKLLLLAIVFSVLTLSGLVSYTGLFAQASDNETKTPNLVLTPYLHDPVYSGNKYSSIFKLVLENKDNCSLQDSVSVKYNLTAPDGTIQLGAFERKIGCSGYSATGNFTPTFAGTYFFCGKITNSTVKEIEFSDNFVCFNRTVIDTTTESCDISLNLTLPETLIYQQGQTLTFKPDLNNRSFPFTLEYWIEDLFGQIVKSRYNTTNTDQKSWKADISETDRVLWVKAIVYPLCKDIDLSNNQAARMILVANENALLKTPNLTSEAASGEAESSLKIVKVTPEKATFGDLLKVSLTVYKGNTNKYSLSAWVEKEGKKISGETKVNLETKYQEYKLTLPVQLLPNCNQKIKPGSATIVVEGLGERAEESIALSGLDSALCSGVSGKSSSSSSSSSSSESKSSKSKFSSEIVDLLSPASSEEILPVKVRLTGDRSPHQLQVWSYLYRGSKCYSCGSGARESNLQESALKAEEEKVLTFYLQLDPGIEAGEYKLAVKIIKDQQKTVQELVQPVLIQTPTEETLSSQTSDTFTGLAKSPEELVAASAFSSKTRLNSTSGYVVYESSTIKSQKVLPYLLLIVFGLLLLVLLRKKQ